jgi:transposase
MDCHIATLDFAVVNDAGRLVRRDCVPTSVDGFMKFVKAVPPPRVVYMEESLLAAWALETCVRFREKLVITGPKKNQWIGSSSQKDDTLDAFKLAELGRGGFIKEIHHPIGERRRFRELMAAYHDSVRSSTRIKNKIKARFRANGVQCNGATVYSVTHREEWREKLPEEVTPRLIMDGLWRQLTESEHTERDLLAAAKAQAKHYPEIKHFQALPGVGFITAATVSAILETTHRFAEKKKVWMYAGLGIATRSSGGKTYSERLSTDYNRLLKYTLKQAAQTAVQATDNPFRHKYLNMTLLNGISPHRAKLTIARAMLATMWAMWRKGDEYDPELRETSLTNKPGLATD